VLSVQTEASVKVAILDEAVLNRETLAHALGGAGIEVVIQHGDPRMFLADLEREHPAVAVVEIPAGDPQGLTVVEETHQFHPWVRILAIADSSDSALMDRCFQAGASGFLSTRNTRLKGFVEAVRALARGDSVLPGHLVESLLRVRDSTPPASKLSLLSAREREVLTYLAAGVDNLKIATILTVSERTVKAHVSSLYRKLGQENRTQLALLARSLGVRPPDNV
jgi:two-component system, NarL family, nitrate/nitrite response regulator NarL